jgi:hypothetical protein
MFSSSNSFSKFLYAYILSFIFFLSSQLDQSGLMNLAILIMAYLCFGSLSAFWSSVVISVPWIQIEQFDQGKTKCNFDNCKEFLPNTPFRSVDLASWKTRKIFSWAPSQIIHLWSLITNDGKVSNNCTEYTMSNTQSLTSSEVFPEGNKFPISHRYKEDI